MADNKELKPKSFRIDDATADKFKEISSQIGGNQQETMAKLIEAYEFQAGKAILTEKKADIEQFEKYITCLTQMYMLSLENNQNLTETVRTEFESLLKSKDITIVDLQERLQRAKETEQKATEQKQQLETELTTITVGFEKKEKEYSGKIENLEKSLKDKDSLNKALTDSCNALKSQIEELKVLKVQLNELNSLKTELEQLKRDCEKKELAHEKELLLLEKETQKEIADLKEKHIIEINYYQNQYKDLLDQQNEKNISTKNEKVTTSSETE